MSEFYIASTLMWNASLEEMVSTVYEANLDGIEMWAQQWFTKEYQVEEYQRLAALYPIKTCVHSCSWDLNPASLNEGIRKASIEEIKKSIDLAVMLGANEVTVHPGNNTVGGMTEVSREVMYDSLQEILKYAEQKHVDISLEIMERKNKEFVVDVTEMGKITKDLADAFFYTLDVAHCESEEVLFEQLRQGKRFSKFHISNRKGEILHTPLPEGDYDFEKLFPQLNAYRIPYIIEGFDAGNEFETMKRNVNYLKTIRGEKR